MDNVVAETGIVLGAVMGICGLLLLGLRWLYGRSVMVPIIVWVCVQCTLVAGIAFHVGRIGLTPVTLGMGCLLGSLGALGLILALDRQVVRPLQRLTASAAVLVEGNVETTFAVRGDNEAAHLARALAATLAYQRALVQLAEALADGDLTQTVRTKSSGDTLGTALERMTVGLRRLVGDARQVGLIVDGLVGEQEIVIKPLGQLVGDVATIVAQAIRNTTTVARSSGVALTGVRHAT